MNVVCIAGNLGQDPEMRYSQAGTAILRFSVAISERVKKGEQWEDATEWVNVTVFGRRAEGLERCLSKGSKVAIQGKLRTDTWQDRDGHRRKSTGIIAENVTLQGERRGRPESRPAETRDQSPDTGDDDIPF